MMELFDHDAQVLEQENSYLLTVRFLSERREIRIKPKLSYMQALNSFSEATVAMDQRMTHGRRGLAAVTTGLPG